VCALSLHGLPYMLFAVVVLYGGAGMYEYGL
jgi:hypothetical protein